ncbi:MAG TPA: cyclase family protein [Terriglobales bacterium]|nr:cyclase family protein [Terriglobales bacterium]
MATDTGSERTGGSAENLFPITAAGAKSADIVCIDLSLPLSNELPVSWPTLPAFHKSLLNWFEAYTEPSGTMVPSKGYFYDQALSMDEHCGTHVDFPIHVLPPARLQKLSGNPPQVSLKSFVGPCAMVDAREHLDQAEPGASPRVKADTVERWEERNGQLRADEIVLLDTGYTDRYFHAFPEGRRFLHQPVMDRTVPGWPVPDGSFFEHLRTRGVRHLGISSPSMGALDDGFGTHLAGIQRGIVFTENLIRLSALPARGAFYIGLPLSIADQSGSPVRAVALVSR